MNRYAFTLRQQFGEEPIVDSFYKLTVPDMDFSQLRVWNTLNPDFATKEMHKDSQTLHGMGLRLRFNSDMYPKICMVRYDGDLEADDLEMIVRQKHRENELKEWLKDAEIL